MKPIEHAQHPSKEVYSQGKILDFMISEYLDICHEDGDLDHMINFPKQLTYAAGCAGTAMDCEIMDTIMNALNARKVTTEFVCKFHAENDAKKQLFILCTQGESGTVGPCLHTCIKKVAEETHVPCCRHGAAQTKAKYPVLNPKKLKLCEVAGHIDIWITGSSCKFFSRMNPGSKAGPFGGGSQHQSSITFDGFIGVIRTRKPSLVFTKTQMLSWTRLPAK